MDVRTLLAKFGVHYTIVPDGKPPHAFASENTTPGLSAMNPRALFGKGENC
jgi:hypothetical protein